MHAEAANRLVRPAVILASTVGAASGICYMVSKSITPEHASRRVSTEHTAIRKVAPPPIPKETTYATAPSMARPSAEDLLAPPVGPQREHKEAEKAEEKPLISSLSDLVSRIADTATHSPQPIPATPPAPPSLEDQFLEEVASDFIDQDIKLPKKSLETLLTPEQSKTIKEAMRMVKEAGFEGSRLAVTGTIGLALIHPLTRLMLATAGRETLKQALPKILKSPLKDLSMSTAPAPLQFFGIAFFPTLIVSSIKALGNDKKDDTPSPTTEIAGTAVGSIWESAIELTGTATGGSWEAARSAGPNASMLKGESINRTILFKDSLNPIKMPGSPLTTVQFMAHALRNMASTMAMNNGAGIASKHITNPLFERAGIPHTQEDGKSPTMVGLIASATTASVAASIASSPFNQVFCLKTQSPTKSLPMILKEVVSSPTKMAVAAATRTLRTGPLVAIIIFLNEASKQVAPNPYSQPAPPPAKADETRTASHKE
jgi:hypothetical protein